MSGAPLGQIRTIDNKELRKIRVTSISTKTVPGHRTPKRLQMRENPAISDWVHISGGSTEG